MKETQEQIRDAEDEAMVLLQFAMDLAKASTSKDDQLKVQALESNLRLWVKIESSLKSAKNLLPKDIKDNLYKLSKYVERLTLSKGINMEKDDFDSLVNINMQISEGLLEVIKIYLAREEAFSLLKCAVDLSSARENNNSSDLVAALDNNLKLWVYIKTLATSKDSDLPEETKGNLIKLADYVSGKTMEVGRNIEKINDKALDSMILTNLQISEGLLSA